MRSSPATTGAAGISAAGIALVLSWFAGLWHLVLPPDVAMVLGAGLLALVHLLSNLVSKPEPLAPPAKEASP